MESNQRHRDFQSLALPTELSGQTIEHIKIHSLRTLFRQEVIERFMNFLKIEHS